MEETVSEAVFGNVGTIIAFRVGATDAEYLEKEFFPVFLQTDLVNLNKYTAYIKLMINGITSRPFSMVTIPPDIKSFGHSAKVIQVSRERYSHKREVVEEKIKRWSGLALEGNADSDNREMRSPRDQRPAYRPDDNRAPRDNRPFYRQDDNREMRAPRDQRPAYRPNPTPMPQQPPKELEDVRLEKPREEITNLASALQQNMRSNDRYDQPRSISHRDSDQGGERNYTRDSRREPRETYRITCERCGKEADVPFKPAPGKPVYCRECYAIIKENNQRTTPAPRLEPLSPTISLSDLKSKQPAQTNNRFSGPRPPSAPART